MSLGLGVLLRVMSGDYDGGEDLIDGVLGKTITSVVLDPAADGRNGFDESDALEIRFTDGTGIGVCDSGQSCCESRYMTCDDDLAYFVGGELVGLELRDAGCDGEGGCDCSDYCHEIQFVLVTTSKGVFTIASHNEHNGYYGGFCLGVYPLDVENEEAA